MVSKEISSTLFAAWIADNYPELYSALAVRANAAATPPLSGFADILRSIGGAIGDTAKNVATGLASGVKTVGSFLSSTEGAKTLSSLAAAYSAINQATIQTQYARSQTGQAPAVIETRFDPATQDYVPLYSPTGEVGYTVNGQLLSELAPSFFKRYGVWLIGGGVALTILYFFMRRK